MLEDGKPQTIEAVDFIDHPAWTPLGERRDPNSQRDGFELAKDPSYRVFVLYLDAFHVDVAGSHRLRVPLGELLNRMLGPKDLFGVLTPAQSPKDLLLGQLTQTHRTNSSPRTGPGGSRISLRADAGGNGSGDGVPRRQADRRAPAPRQGLCRPRRARRPCSATFGRSARTSSFFRTRCRRPAPAPPVSPAIRIGARRPAADWRDA